MTDLVALMAAAEATWPPAAACRLGPWTIREGQGGGKRVSAATAEAPVGPDDFAPAEAAMRGRGQPPLVMVRAGQDALDGLLATRGYLASVPVLVYAAPGDCLSGLTASSRSYPVWSPLQITRDIWADAGVGPERQAVMARVAGPKIAVQGRAGERPAGAAFAAIHENIAMIHAVVVSPACRRQKVAVNMMRAAAIWAQDRGADSLAVLVTEDNRPARALCASLNMQVVGNYHYRMLPHSGG